MTAIDSSPRGIVTDASRYYDISGRAARRRQLSQTNVLAARVAMPTLAERVTPPSPELPSPVPPAPPASPSTAQQLNQLKLMLMRDYPDVRGEAGKAIADEISRLHPALPRLDPDQVYFDMFSGASQSHQSYNGWAHRGRPRESLSLTDLQLRNFPADFGGDPASLDADTGVYTEGAQGRVFDQHDEIRLTASDLKTAVRASHFYTRYHDLLSRFYDQHGAALRLVAEANLLDDAASAGRGGQAPLSAQALAMLSEAAGHEGHGLAPQRTKSYVFDIDGYASRDMSWLYAPADGHVLLLMPNDAQPVREYASLAAMRSDIASMARSAAGRERLARHFSVYNRRDGQLYQGIDKWLLDIGRGGWNARIAEAPSLINTSVFENQVERMRDADLDNVRYLVRSDEEISRQELIQAFGAFNSVLGNPLTQAIELGLEIRDQRSAGQADDRAHAVSAAWHAGVGLALNLLMMGLVGAGASLESTSGAGERPGFRAPSRLPDGRTGYPLSPVDPPRLPGAEPTPGPSTQPEASAAAGSSTATAAADILPPGAVRNGLGMLERTDIQFLYRAVRLDVAQRHDPARFGFMPSRSFEVDPMIDGPIVVTSSNKAGAIEFGEGAFDGKFALYQIDATGLRAASLYENTEFNAIQLSRHLGLEDHVVDAWKADDTATRNVGDGALSYGEVHLSMEGLAPERIHRIPNTTDRSILSGYDSDGVSTDRELSSGDEA